MKTYHIPAGTEISRLQGSIGQYGTVGPWYRFTTIRAVTYTEKEVITHGTHDVGWVFKLPKSARPWTHISVKHKDIIFFVQYR